jgi:hypothetical protein
MRIATDTVVFDSGVPDRLALEAAQMAIQDLPNDALLFLLGSRYCDSDLLQNIAWEHFGHVHPGWARVQAIYNFVHNRIMFDYEHARTTRTAVGAYEEKRGVCRDYAHLAIGLSSSEHTGSLLHSRNLIRPGILRHGSKPSWVVSGTLSIQGTMCPA